ncbi:amino acid adenylation domain protein [Desulfitobacterium hafniense DCB-2]|uniref:Amino acid adenylation domain protein n=2 Tax=root TaxID=1 RepID=B8FSW2_DESHD|nr:non-ribosomal peptide synthetase [Desulfitobacterium hafniense]ACL21978.1 amino acid adenylation domain protein [Desulfitobacterium hafniense DCB-2]MEA5022354.1 non-ribosomal peptide synthetase [Desulfitobacterium hafniense]
MTIEKRMKEFRNQGIVLWPEGTALKFKAPKGVVTEEIRSFLKENKQRIIQYLEGNQQAAWARNRAGRFNKFPLTDIQNSYVVGRNKHYELGGVACHGYLEIEFEEILDIERLETAWNKVIQKHDMLRAIVYDVGYQIVQETVPLVRIPAIDLRGGGNDKGREALRKSLAHKQYPLGQWPMCDVAVSIDEEKSVVHFSVDMLIADFSSMNIILNDLEHFYRNPEEPISYPTLYRDSVMYQNDRKMLNPQERQAAEAYWEQKLPSLGEAPELPVIKKTGLTEHTFSQKKLFLERERWQGFCERAKDAQITPSVLVMAALAEVTALWSSSHKFSINTTIFNRPPLAEDIHQVVGDFTDVIVSSIDLDFSIPFSQRAQAIQKDLWTDLEHSALSGVEVLRKMTKERKKNIIIPVVFTSTAGIAGKEDATVRRSIRYKISQTPQVYLDCQVADENGGAKINWDVRDGVFEEPVISDMFESFSRLISSLCEPEQQVLADYFPVELPLGTREVRNITNSTAREYPPRMMEEGFLHALRHYPNKTALITDREEFTYASFSRYVKTVVDLLKEQDVRPGDRVGISIDKNQWQIAAVMAVLLVKGTYVPIDVHQPSARQEKIIKGAGIKVLLIQDEDYSSQKGHPAREGCSAQGGCPPWEGCTTINLQGVSLGNEPLDVFTSDPDDSGSGGPGSAAPGSVALGSASSGPDYDRPAYIIFTSGTTGEPKGVVISHRAAMNTIMDVNHRYGIDESDVFLCLANLSFDLSVYDIFGCFAAGGTLVMPASSQIRDPKYLYDLILLNRISVWNSVPAQMQMVVNYLESVESMKKKTSLSKVFLSGDWIPVNLPERIGAMFPQARVVSMGGATEASIWSIYYDIAKGEVFGKSVPYGKPMANQRFYVLNGEGRPCPDYVEGNLYIAGDGLSLGYLNDEKLNGEKYGRLPATGERIYRTGDRGYYRRDGNIMFRGREAGDEQIKIHGHRIELAEIRTALTDYPLIDSALALAVGTPPDELKISAVMTPKRRSEQQDIEPDDQELAMLAAAGRFYETGMDGELLEKWTTKSEEVVISDIYHTFKGFGIFAEVDKRHSFGEIMQTMNIPEKLHKLTRLWLQVLVKEGVLREEEQTFALVEHNLHLDSGALWDEFYRIEEEFNYSREFVDYLKKSSDVLPEMIQGQENPLNVLFPKGDVAPAMAAYHDNKINQIQNGIAVKEVLYLCRQANQKEPGRPFRILEVGAGVGGTSLDLIPQLEGRQVEYHFTDLSAFFLNHAQENFRSYEWVNYGLFDINQDFALQGYEAFSFDLILCANVLHNARDIHEVMDNLKHLLVDRGTMIILEETRVSYMLLTSMEFKDGLTGFQDERGEEQTFFTRAQWEKIFSRHGGEIVFEFPGQDSKLDISGQTIYITRYAGEYEPLDKGRVQEHLANTVAPYMIPSTLLVLPALPLTDNKKVDMGRVRAYLEQNHQASGTEPGEKALPETELEKRIAVIWCRELKIASFGREDNFYEVGGDSLLIAQVVGKMVEEIEEAEGWEWSALLTEMMQTPTVKEVAAKIERFFSHRDTFIDPSLIQIKDSRLPREQSVAKVLFHAGTGTLSAYTDLIAYIEKDSKEDESVLGFSFGNEVDYISMETQDTFKLLGKKYGKILSSLGFANYILIGHCVGGVIALEAAEHLRESGHRVSDVTLISATIQMQKEMTHYRELPDQVYARALETSLDNELLLERTFARLINANEYEAGYTTQEADLERCIEFLVKERQGEVSAEALCSLDGPYQEIGDNFKELSRKPISERLNDLYATIERSESNLMEHERRMLNTLFNIFSQNFGCVASHEPRPYGGQVRLFSCEQQEGSFFREFFGENLETWLPYLQGEYTYEVIAGQHFDCIVEPNLQKNIGRILNFRY